MAMRPILLLLTAGLLGASVTNATNQPALDIDPTSRKEELQGTVQHSETKKPLTRVNVTAYLVSQKQKSVISDDNGNYSFADLKPGIYRFIFEKAGFKKVTKEKVVVKTDEGFQMNIEMEETRHFDLGPSALHFSDF